MAKINIKIPLSQAVDVTRERIGRVAGYRSSIESDDDQFLRVIHFLRGAACRSTFLMPALYHYIGAIKQAVDGAHQGNGARLANQSLLRWKMVGSIALDVRAIFDHEKAPLCAKVVTNMQPDTTQKLIDYWCNKGKFNQNEVALTVAFIRRFLSRCAISRNDAAKGGCALACRIALMKEYANRQVAHISLHNYEFDTADVLHAATAVAVFGAAINQFDNPTSWPASYFSEGDRVAFEAARSVFPSLSKISPLFGGDDGAKLIRQVSLGIFRPGEEYLSAYLPGALGFDGISPEALNALRWP